MWSGWRAVQSAAAVQIAEEHDFQVVRQPKVQLSQLILSRRACNYPLIRINLVLMLICYTQSSNFQQVVLGCSLIFNNTQLQCEINRLWAGWCLIGINQIEIHFKQPEANFGGAFGSFWSRRSYTGIIIIRSILPLLGAPLTVLNAHLVTSLAVQGLQILQCQLNGWMHLNWIAKTAAAAYDNKEKCGHAIAFHNNNQTLCTWVSSIILSRHRTGVSQRSCKLLWSCHVKASHTATCYKSVHSSSQELRCLM